MGTWPIIHTPTYMLIIGYVLFWVEFFFSPLARQGLTTPIAWIVWIICCGSLLFNQRYQSSISIKDFWHVFLTKQTWLKIFGGTVALVTLIIVIISCVAYQLTPHLEQEFDAINYHMALSRQHLMVGSLQLLPWSIFDLFIMPMQYALAPFWFTTILPNKFPQGIFFLSLLLVTAAVSWRLGQRSCWMVIASIACIFGCHAFGIQFGTAMMDLATIYLLLAFIHSILVGAYGLAAIEFAFLFWSKPLMPFLLLGVIITTWIMVVIFKQLGWNITWGFNLEDRFYLDYEFTPKDLLKRLGMFLLVSLFIAAPFLVKSYYYTHVPLYPMPTATIQNQDQPFNQVLLERTDFLINGMRHAYGHGRSLIEFGKHFFTMALPEKGFVTNRFDYPLGLSYLLMIVPFLVLFIRQIITKRMSIIAIAIMLWWLSWWLSTQQTRFLFIPVLLMMFLVLLTLKEYQSRILSAALAIALIFNMVSVFRAHRADFGKDSMSVLRGKDRVVFNMQPQLGERFIYLEDQQALFAQYPVKMKKAGKNVILGY